jgi:hypothetical protein
MLAFRLLKDAKAILANAVYTNGRPWVQQYAENLVQGNTDLTWVTDTVFPTALYGAMAFVTKDRAYVVGGYNASGVALNTCYSAPINASGIIGAWSLGANLPYGIYNAQIIVTNSRVYLIGGSSSIGGYGLSRELSASINADGTLSAWKEGQFYYTGNILYGVGANTQVFVTKNRAYIACGAQAVADPGIVITAIINSDGTFGTWSLAGNLPSKFSCGQAIVTKNRVYLLSGVTTAVVINTDGTVGAWTTATALPAAVAASQIVITNSTVYMIGGYTGTSTNLATVYRAPINADGTLGAWVVGTPLPGVRRYAWSFITSSRIYFGTGIGPSYSAVVYSAPFNGGLNNYLSSTGSNVSLIPSSDFTPEPYSVPTGASTYIIGNPWKIKACLIIHKQVILLAGQQFLL